MTRGTDIVSDEFNWTEVTETSVGTIEGVTIAHHATDGNASREPFKGGHYCNEETRPGRSISDTLNGYFVTLSGSSANVESSKFVRRCLRVVQSSLPNRVILQ